MYRHLIKTFHNAHLIQTNKITGIAGYQSSNGLVRDTGAAVNLQCCKVPADRPQVGILHNKMQPGSFQAGGWWFLSYNGTKMYFDDADSPVVS
ncbi:hypothetical protein BFJ63_vAg8928 [Fusarium oxysporum f. sp. narcissi]|uniref:Uncharacterized protein n=1 Tax=Fusarium oxysporum f. sp. narcissi TaxID=451672 RepID=A0A4Q2VNW1_FUSOX|nr:hypothetical protein BFJ63_vAg8928 [Fusarium oxysporum f. sp. narcissi]